MRFVLHIGPPKTGTSAIQNFLCKHADKLLHTYSILYPESGRAGDPVLNINIKLPAHVLFPFSVLPNGKKLYGELADAKNLKISLMNEIKKYKPNTIIISAEHFSYLNEKEIKSFKELYDFPVTEIIFYVRRQDLILESFYSQAIRDHNTKLYLHFDDFVDNALHLGWQGRILRYYEYFSSWKQAFPEAKIIPRIYDRKLFPDGNVILDFLSVLGIDMPEAREYKIEVNPSLSHLSALAMRRINEEFNLSPEDHQKVVNYLLQLDKQEGSPIKTFFTLQERIEFLERFRESNEKLFREYFGTENQFVLSEEEIEFYKEQDKIPREVVEKAVEERYRKVLEFMKVNCILAKEKLFPKVRVNYLQHNLEFFRIDVLHANLLNGRLIVGGLALPKDIEENLNLKIKDAEGMKEVQWGLPSPYFGEQRKDNPKAKNARFRVDNVVVWDKPIEVYVNGNKVAEIVLETRNWT